MNKLEGHEIARLNQVIGKCQLLINARGNHNALSAGVYEQAPFAIYLSVEGERSRLQIEHGGRRVAIIEWAGAAPGAALFSGRDERWIDELMAVPGAHS